MKKQILFTAILAFFYSIGNAQWQQLGGYSEHGNARSMVFNNDTMIASHCGNAYEQFGLYTSPDYGVTWSSNTILGQAAHPIIEDGGNLYAGTWGDGVFFSTDNGNSWVAKNNGLPSNFSVLDLIKINNEMYVCGTGGIYYSNDSAESWEDISFPGTVQAMCIVVAENTLIASFSTQSAWGVYKSTDNGANWILIDPSSGLTDNSIGELSYHFDIIYAAAEMGSGNVYLSNDSGISWTTAAGFEDQGYNQVYDFIAYNDTMYSATINGVYKSIDYGLNWINTGCFNAMSLEIAGDTLFTGTGFNGIWKYELNPELTRIEENENYVDIVVYPNPASNILKIDLNQNRLLDKTSVSIYSIQGQLLIQQSLLKDIAELDISALEKGIYILKLKGIENIGVARFVKE